MAATTAVIPLGKVVGTTIAAAPAAPAIGIGIGLAAIGGAIALAVPKILEIRNRNETVVSRAPVPQGRGSTSYREKEETKSKNRLILSDKQVAEIEGAMKHAQIALEIDIKVAEREKSPDKKRPPRAHVASAMWNAQHRTLKLYSFGSFSGNFVVKPPESMFESPRFIGLFLHQGNDPDDSKSGDYKSGDSKPGDSKPGESKGYVIYGTDEDSPLLLYILAWCKPAKGSPKVYVQAGLLPNMLKQPYNSIKQGGNLSDYLLNQLKDQIRQKLMNQLDDQTRQTLNELKGDQCSSHDPETGAEAAAEIRSVYPGCSWALLGAAFSRREH